ncbi:MAG: hypothetical protein V2I33_05900 [Kangiellaceae bacterium]|nr:hypothetical protein [Kangiellaceae bacterium]
MNKFTNIDRYFEQFVKLPLAVEVTRTISGSPVTSYFVDSLIDCRYR